MSQHRIRYFVVKDGRRDPATGARLSRYFWQPSAELRAAGWPAGRLVDAATRRRFETRDDWLAAAQAAEALNARLDAWYAAGRPEDGIDAAPHIEGWQRLTSAPSREGANLKRITPIPGTFDALAAEYRGNFRFTRLAPKTRRDYGWHLDRLAETFGDLPVAAIDAEAVELWYERHKTPHLASANASIRVLRRVLGYAVKRPSTYGLADNPAARPELEATPPRLRTASHAEIDALIAAADAAGWPSIGDAVVLAAWSGQRQGDLLALPMPEIVNDGAQILLRTRKTGARVAMPAHPRIVARLGAARARIAALTLRLGLRHAPAEALVCETTGRRWTADYFRHVFAAIRAAAATACPALLADPAQDGLGLNFQDLRDTAVTWLGEAGCTIPEICAITGHSEASAYRVLRHYLALNGAMASNAIAKLVEYEAKREAEG